MRLRELHNGHIIAACAFFIPTLGVYLSGFFIPLLILMALLALVLSFWKKTSRLKIPWLTATFFIVLVSWGGLSSLWSVAPERSVIQALELLGIAACGLMLLAGASTLEPHERRPISLALIAGFATATVFMTIEVFTDLAIYRLENPPWGNEYALYIKFNRWTALSALLVWPILLSIGTRPRPYMVVTIFVLLFVILIQLENSSSLVGLCIGLVAFVLALNSPRRTAIAFICLTMAGTALAPNVPRILPEPKVLWEAVPAIPTSVIHRLHIWRYVADRVEERPFTGWGLDTSRDMPGRAQVVWDVGKGGEVLPLHPHNAILQWWMELGLFGAAIGGLFMTWLFVAIQRKQMDPFQNAVFIGALVTGIVIASTSYGIWQSWWLALLFLITAVMVGLGKEEGAKPC